MPDRLFRPHAAVPFSPADGTSAPGPVFGYRKASPPAPPAGSHSENTPAAKKALSSRSCPQPSDAGPSQHPAHRKAESRCGPRREKSPLRKERAADSAQGAPNAAENIPGFAEKCSLFCGKAPRPHREAPCPAEGALTTSQKHRLAGEEPPLFAPRRNMLLCRRGFSSAEEAPQAPQGNQHTLPRRAPPKIPLTGSPTSPKCRAAPHSRQS